MGVFKHIHTIYELVGLSCEGKEEQAVSKIADVCEYLQEDTIDSLRYLVYNWYSLPQDKKDAIKELLSV